MVYGESGQIPPSIDCLYNVFCFLNRVSFMNDNTIVKKVYNELFILQECGFETCLGKARILMNNYGLTFNSNKNDFKRNTKLILRNNFIKEWSNEMCNIEKNPIIRTYSIFKKNFGTESYLKNVSNFKYRQAITKLKTSSHDLMVEKGRHLAIPLNINERLCFLCKQTEDEIHFLIKCPLYSSERMKLLREIDMNFDILELSDPTN